MPGCLGVPARCFPSPVSLALIMLPLCMGEYPLGLKPKSWACPTLVVFAGKQAEVLNMIIKDLWEGHPVSERQLKAVLRSPGASDSSISLPEDIEADKRLTLTTYSSRSFDDNEESLKVTLSLRCLPTSSPLTTATSSPSQQLTPVLPP